MTNAGSHNDTLNDPTDPTIAPDDNTLSGLHMVLFFGGGALLLCVALVVGWQVFGVFFGILLPPTPPVPANATEIRHHSAAYGQDEWVYAVAQPACEVAQYYVDLGVCPLPRSCATNRDLLNGQTLATCAAWQAFSIFDMYWQAEIQAGALPGSARMTLTRRIYWGGEPPDDPTEPDPRANR